MLRQDLERLLREATLTALAFAIALGWALYQAASGFAYLITTGLTSFDDADTAVVGGSLTWRLGKHVLVFAPLIQGLVELAVVLVLVLLVRRRFRPASV
jgi:hypothetical protein